MDEDDRPEDEPRDEGNEPHAGEEPDDLGIFGLDRDSGSQEPEPVEEPGEPGGSGGSEPSGEEDYPAAGEEAGATGPGPPTHRALRVLVVLAGALAVALFLVGWNRVATSDAFCSSCHEIEPAVQSADRSVHADVPCLSCHTGSGVLGALRYIPTLARETVDEFTGWDVAHGVLDPRSCTSCHEDLTATPELAAAHENATDCASCHGDVAHPPLRLAGFDRPVDQLGESQVHPRLYVQTHGNDVVTDPESCRECHQTDFCETCHLGGTYPHPNDWIRTHGPTQIEMGEQTCQGCHAPTFCEGCHGTEIPHNVRWLGEHWRDLRDASTTPCMLCHPRTDCTDCHAEHQVHREQDLYA